MIINILQVHFPQWLPHQLQTWSWLPRPLHTLAWYDEHLFNSHKRLICCNTNESKQSTNIIDPNMNNNYQYTNKSYMNNDDFDRLSGISTRF